MKLLSKSKSLFAVTVFALTVSHQALAQEQPPAQLVNVEQVKTEKVKPSIWLPGNVVSRKDSVISAEQMGQLLSIVDIGTELKKGDVIAKIDDRHLQLQLKQQQARITQQKADVDYLRSQKKRLSALSKKNNTSESELEKVTKDLVVAESEVVALQMQAEQTELAIEKSQIRAPFDGSISERFATQGQLVTVGQSLTKLVDTKSIDIEVSAPLSIARFIEQADTTLIKLGDELIEAPVRTWSKAGELRTRSFKVLLNADNQILTPGTAVTVSLPKAAEQLATLIPRDALVLREKETYILVVDEQDQAQKVNVNIGQGVGDWLSISGDVEAGDEVIVRGGERLRVGQKVKRQNVLVAKLN